MVAPPGDTIQTDCRKAQTRNCCAPGSILPVLKDFKIGTTWPLVDLCLLGQCYLNARAVKKRSKYSTNVRYVLDSCYVVGYDS